jgi:HPt (histidine-containing phosphotransfer) domain-containing protein
MIDWARVRELRSEVGDEAFAEVTDMFLEEVDEVVARLQARPDPARFGDDFHFLKGAALNLGFSDMATHCSKGEHLSGIGMAAEAELLAVITSYANSRAEFLQKVETQSGA